MWLKAPNVTNLLFSTVGMFPFATASSSGDESCGIDGGSPKWNTMTMVDIDDNTHPLL